MPKNRYDPLLFLPYSLSGACQGKTTSEPYGTRLSFETHRTGEPSIVPGSSKQEVQHMAKAQRIPLKKGKKKRRTSLIKNSGALKTSRVKAETALSHSLIAYLKDLKLRADNSENDSNVHKNMATLLNARTSLTASLLSGISSSMSFCPRTEPQKTMTKKQNGPTDCSASPFTFLWCRRGDSNSHEGTFTRP